MFAEGDRVSWLNAVAAQIQDGGVNPPSLIRLTWSVPPNIVTKESDGHCTAAKAFGESARGDMKAGWGVIVTEMVTVLREQGFVGGSDEALTWIKPVDGTWSVTMPGNRQVTVFGQRERRMSRDRSIVGERDETTGERVGPPSLFEGGRIHPLELQVIGQRGGITTQKFELHPLALALPPMTEAEREVLRKSIERDGVKVAIVIYEKKILDGRNRSYFASVFKKPVRLEEFIGTEEEARRHVAILNLHRRHLSVAQRYLVADNLFGKQAEKEAMAAKRSGVSKNLPLKIAEGNSKDRSGESHERAAKLATDAGIANITPAGMRLIKELRDAPKTTRKVESGEIQRMSKAVADARTEKGLPKQKSESVRADPRTITRYLGECIGNLNAVLTNLEMPVGSMPDKISERLREIVRLSGEIEQTLRARKVFK